MTIDAELDRTLRLVLGEQRPAAATPAALRSRIHAIPDDLPREWLPVRLLRAHLVPIAASGIAIAAVVAAVFGFSRVPVVGLPPGGVGGPGGIPLDPSIEGAGLITSLFRSMAIVSFGIAILAGIVALRELLSPRVSTTRGRVVLMAAATVAVLASGAGNVNGFSFLDRGGSSAVLLGAGLEAPSVPFQQGAVYYVTASPGEPVVTMFTVRNHSPVPVRVEGIVVPEGYDQLAAVHWTAAWLPGGDQPIGDAGLANMRPFEPTTIGADQELQVYLVAEAGRCAFGPTFDPATWETDGLVGGMSSVGPTVEVAYSVFGLTSTQAIDTFYTLAEPSRQDCR